MNRYVRLSIYVSLYLSAKRPAIWRAQPPIRELTKEGLGKGGLATPRVLGDRDHAIGSSQKGV